MAEKQTELHLEFRNIHFSVALKDRTTKTILHNVSGAASSNRLLAIMGPSGAGKSTLLDVLAGAPLQGKAEGELLLNNVPRAQTPFKHMSCYVMQRDVLLESATVQEALMTSALLQLPRSMPRSEKQARVDSVLDMLDLQRCADTLIGDEVMGMKGISGGERRRVSLGVELVRNPRVIFLDEPTTGLDSEMALSVMRAVARLAHSNRLVVATIHQPNSDITDLFDDFMLLARGRAMYAGSWSGAVPHFTSLGHSCPLYKNPSDYFMSLASDQDTVAQLAELQLQHYTPGKASHTDVEAPGSAQALQQHHSDADAAELADQVPLGPAAPAWYQVVVLAQRFLRSWLRHPLLLASEAGQFIFMAVFLGLTYLRMTSELPNGAQDRVSSLFFTLACLVWVPSYTIIVVWDKERLLLRRESANGAYKPSSFFLAKTLTTSPIVVLESLLFAIIIYFMIGYQATFVKFITFAIILVLFTLASETIGFLCALASPDSKVGIILISMLLIILLTFSGYMVAAVPVYFAWIGRISFFSYAQAALVGNEFEGLVLQQAGQAVDGFTLLPPSVLNGLSVWGNIGVLAGMVVGMRVLAFLALEWGSRRRRG